MRDKVSGLGSRVAADCALRYRTEPDAALVQALALLLTDRPDAALRQADAAERTGADGASCALVRTIACAGLGQTAAARAHAARAEAARAALR